MIEPVETLEGHQDRVWCVKWNYKGDTIISSSADKSVKLWQNRIGNKGDGPNWKTTDTLKYAHNRTIRFASFSPDDRFLVTASFDSTVVIWKYTLAAWEQHQTLDGHENEVKCAVFSPSGRFLATCSRDKSVWFWEIDEDDDFSCCSVLQSAHSADVKSLAWHPNEEILVSCSYDCSMQFYGFDPEEDWVNTCKLKEAHDDTIWSICFDEEGKHLFSAGGDAVVKLWRRHIDESKSPMERDSWHVLICLDATYHHGQVIYSIDYSPNIGFIATGAADNAIRIFKVENLQNEQPLMSLSHCFDDAHEDEINSVSWCPSTNQGVILASGSDDKLVKVWLLNL